MSKGADYTGHIRGFVVPKGNCGKDLKERCPHCGQFHLRAGYCQALDPQKTAIAAGRDAWIAKRAAELRALNGFSDESVTLSESDVTLNVPDRDIVTDNYCVECGVVFESKRTGAKFCSPACRKKASRRDG